jgi:hypothetical protein
MKLLVAGMILLALVVVAPAPVADAGCAPTASECVLWCPDSPKSTESCRLFPGGLPVT